MAKIKKTKTKTATTKTAQFEVAWSGSAWGEKSAGSTKKKKKAKFKVGDKVRVTNYAPLSGKSGSISLVMDGIYHVHIDGRDFSLYEHQLKPDNAGVWGQEKI